MDGLLDSPYKVAAYLAETRYDSLDYTIQGDSIVDSVLEFLPIGRFLIGKADHLVKLYRTLDGHLILQMHEEAILDGSVRLELTPPSAPKIDGMSVAMLKEEKAE
jgi:hypothetical protein